MATKKLEKTRKSPNPGGNTGTIVDPAEKYYEQSRKDREAYKKAVKMGGMISDWSDYLAQRNRPVLGQEGNTRSRSGFDGRTFRKI